MPGPARSVYSGLTGFPVKNRDPVVYSRYLLFIMSHFFISVGYRYITSSFSHAVNSCSIYFKVSQSPEMYYICVLMKFDVY